MRESRPSARAPLPELGAQFGRWTVVRRAEATDSRHRTVFHCRCACGVERTIRHDVLKTGLSASCGCLAREKSAARKRTHGVTAGHKTNGTGTYVSWKGMKQRCYDPKHDAYPHYGAMSVVVCDRWRNSFINFVTDMGERPDGLTLDRIDPNGNYEPSNCRWADMVTQNNNQRRHRAAAA